MDKFIKVYAIVGLLVFTLCFFWLVVDLFGSNTLANTIAGLIWLSFVGSLGYSFELYYKDREK